VLVRTACHYSFARRLAAASDHQAPASHSAKTRAS